MKGKSYFIPNPNVSIADFASVGPVSEEARHVLTLIAMSLMQTRGPKFVLDALATIKELPAISPLTIAVYSAK